MNLELEITGLVGDCAVISASLSGVNARVGAISEIILMSQFFGLTRFECGKSERLDSDCDLFMYIHVLFQLRIGDSAKKDYVLISD